MTRLLSYYRPYVPRLLLATLMMALAAAGPTAVVLLVEQVLDRVLVQKDAAGLALLPFAIVALYALSGALNVTRAIITRGVAFRVVTTLRGELFRALLAQEPGWHQRVPLGERLSWLSNDVGQVQYLVSAWATLVQKPLALAGLLAAALWMDWRLTCAALVVLPLVVFPITAFGRRMRKVAAERLQSLASLSTSAQQSLAGLRTVQAFGAEAGQAARFDADNETQYRVQMQAVLAGLLPGPIIELIAAVGVGLVLSYGGHRVFSGELQPGELVAFLVALGLMNVPLKQLSEVVSLTQRALAGAERVFVVLDRPPTLADGDIDLDADHVELCFEGMSFDYGDGPVLHGLTERIEAGQKVAVVGASGAGKTTLLSLVARFLDPSGGRLLLNGRPASDYSLASLRAHIAQVGQEPFLFHASVLENLRLGRPDASRADVETACRAANAHAFVAALPDGYDTVVDETGLRLSGGQRQRLCIARALLMDAPLLLLDEATSALDSQSEALVQQALERLMQGRTVLMVAHRLSSITGADRILVLSDGRLVQAGPHKQLIEEGGEYGRLYG
jgi:subfamily B ATP-binding cassette protein MsbA